MDLLPVKIFINKHLHQVGNDLEFYVISHLFEYSVILFLFIIID